MAYLGIGSNIGNKVFNCEQSIDRINQTPGFQVSACSSIFKTEPEGVSGQDWYANCVVKGDTTYSPQQLLKRLLAIEQEMRRVRETRWGPRIIDLDILFFDGEIIDSDSLTVPHPLLHKRRFVLEPLAQLAPDLLHPLLNRTVSHLLNNLPPHTKGAVQILKEVK